MKEIILGGGCFWGMEAYFKRLNGVLETEVAYANGQTKEQSYKKVCTNKTGHAEVIVKVAILDRNIERVFIIPTLQI